MILRVILIEISHFHIYKQCKLCVCNCCCCFCQFSSFSCFPCNGSCVCVCVRLKSVITRDDQEKNRNAAFLQILISFYIQSEVVCLFLLSVSPSI